MKRTYIKKRQNNLSQMKTFTILHEFARKLVLLHWFYLNVHYLHEV